MTVADLAERFQSKYPQRGRKRLCTQEKARYIESIFIGIPQEPMFVDYSDEEPIFIKGEDRVKALVDFFILASYEETFAQTPLEAMACGTPVMSTPCSGASDLIKPFNGVVCDGFDSNALAEGITKTLSTEYNSNKIRQHIIDEYEYSNIATLVSR